LWDEPWHGHQVCQRWGVHGRRVGQAGRGGRGEAAWGPGVHCSCLQAMRTLRALTACACQHTRPRRCCLPLLRPPSRQVDASPSHKTGEDHAGSACTASAQPILHLGASLRSSRPAPPLPSTALPTSISCACRAGMPLLSLIPCTAAPIGAPRAGCMGACAHRQHGAMASVSVESWYWMCQCGVMVLSGEYGPLPNSCDIGLHWLVAALRCRTLLAPPCLAWHSFARSSSKSMRNDRAGGTHHHEPPMDIPPQGIGCSHIYIFVHALVGLMQRCQRGSSNPAPNLCSSIHRSTVKYGAPTMYTTAHPPQHPPCAHHFCSDPYVRPTTDNTPMLSICTASLDTLPRYTHT